MQTLDDNKLEQMTDSGIDNLKVEIEKELDVKQQNYSIVEQEYLSKQLAIIDLQKSKKELEVMLSKEKSIIRTLNSQIRILTSKYWKKRHGG